MIDKIKIYINGVLRDIMEVTVIVIIFIIVSIITIFSYEKSE